MACVRQDGSHAFHRVGEPTLFSGIDRDMPMPGSQTMSGVVAKSLMQQRYGTLLPALPPWRRCLQQQEAHTLLAQAVRLQTTNQCDQSQSCAFRTVSSERVRETSKLVYDPELVLICWICLL